MLSTTPFPSDSSTLLLQGEAGQLDVGVTLPKIPNTENVIIICHPHPLYGGSMDNKVVSTLVRTFRELDFCTVRFNFRGVGHSEGEHDQGLGEARDLELILNWVVQALPDANVLLAGFSFGSYVAYRVAATSQHKENIQQLLLVAPPVQYPEFSSLPEPTMPVLVVQGEADEVVEPDKVFAWVKQTLPEATLLRMPDTSHFFHGKLIELKRLLIQDFS